MQERLLERKDVPRFVEALQQELDVLGPMDRGGEIVLGRILSPDRLDLDYHQIGLSPKEVFFPRWETMGHVEGDRLVEDLPKQRGFVLLGIRPCDARALTFLDLVFEWRGIRDPYYVDRRENGIVMTLACRHPMSTCFCTSVGGAPDDERGSDVMLFAVPEAFVVRTVSEKGTELIDKVAGAFLGEVPRRHLDARAEAIRAANERLEKIDLSGVKSGLDAGFGAGHWEAIALPCLGCGTCAYVCPTCHCFDIVDEVCEGTARRIRCWDTCQFQLFTYHGSGHQPRPSTAERQRQRVMHKLAYAVDNYAETFCVGCGRCVRHCPAGLDVRETIALMGAVP